MGISSSLFDDFSILGLPKEREVAMQHCLNVVPVNIIEEQKHPCDHGLSVDDLITTLHEMYDDKVPRFDGFPCDFYKATWIFLRPRLL
jgi:hypothetical protein